MENFNIHNPRLNWKILVGGLSAWVIFFQATDLSQSNGLSQAIILSEVA